MRTLKISLEYGCYPIWLYNEEGIVLDNSLPPELRDIPNLEDALRRIQTIFESGFFNTPEEFGSSPYTEEEKAELRPLIKKVEDILHEKALGYHIVNTIKV